MIIELELISGNTLYVNIDKTIPFSISWSNKGHFILKHPTHNNGGWCLADHYTIKALLKIVDI